MKSQKYLKIVTIVLSIALVVGPLVFFSAPAKPVLAADYTITAAFPDMGAAAGAFNLNGDASAQPGYIRLTRNAIGMWGSAFSVDKVTMPSNFAFNAYFTFQIIPGPPPGRWDGLRDSAVSQCPQWRRG